MPRTKATARGKGLLAPPVAIGFDADETDALPSGVLEYLLAIPSSDAADVPQDASSSDSERSPKRRKVETRPDSSVSVAKGEVSFCRRCTEQAPTSFTKTVHDAGSHLGFHVKTGHFTDLCLSISSRPASPLGSLLTDIALEPQDVTENAHRILEAFGYSVGYRSKQNSPGAIWSVVDMLVKRDGGMASVEFSFELFWNETPSPYLPLRNTIDRKVSQTLIDAFFSAPKPTGDDAAWSPMDFYDAAYVPLKDDHTSQTIEVPGLEVTLFPYQKRSLQWLLGREGMQWSGADSGLQLVPKENAMSGIDGFRVVRDTEGNDVFVSDVFQTITRDISLYQQADAAVKGGILAEEMGLGKTLEILGLILLNGRPNPPAPEEAKTEAGLTPSRATLIVTPESLRLQWISEISRHAPNLRVKHYQGCKKLQEDEVEETVAELATYDVVITTYAVFSAELHFTVEPPQRPRRYERAYPRTISPLVKISWWRLCLDEAQMIENGYTQAAAVARVIPRINAWGITGTPVKDDIRDLLGLLLFLQYEPYCSASQVWQGLIKGHKPIFQQIFRSISLRHTKALVREEILLPPQKRYVISMPFAAVEEQHYQSLFKEMAGECNLDLDGAPIVEDWRPEDYEDVMRMRLNRLRQTTLHPEVGMSNRRLLGFSKARPMRTVDEVLDAMLDQNENAIRTDEKAYLSSRLARGQLYENTPQVREALTIWEEVRTETEKLVADARTRLKDAIREHGGDEAIKEAENDALEVSSESDDEHEEGETKGRIGECRRRLRSALELHHKAVFFCANAHFQIRDNAEMTEPESDEFKRLKKLEDDGYEKAKVIRREILRESNRKASRLMNRIARKAANQTFTEIPELAIKAKKGIESGPIIDKLEMLYGELNQQANVLDDWREGVVQLLLRPLVDEDDNVETTGEELGDSAKFQELLMVYVQVLRAAIADRLDAISGQANELVRYETETSIKLANEGGGPAPEKLLEMLGKRATIKPGLGQISMRGAISDFRGLQPRLARDASETAREAMESKIASDQLRATQAQLNEQNKAALALESEIESFKVAMNTRLEYYRQLQAVSDAVLPHDGPNSEDVIAKMKQAEEELRRKLWSAEAKHRYLLNLKEAGSKSNEPRMCVICQMPFVTGVLTVCGHQFCKECMTLWFKAHHNCPVCKKGLKPFNLHDITIKPQQLQVRSDEPGRATADDQTPTSPQKRIKTAIYSEFSSEQLAEIKNIELDGPSFTTKVDTLVRHLLWLRESDPGAKAIVFSQYRDFLNVLRNAFRCFHIGHASIDDPQGIAKFKEDPAIEVFLLHARAHSSGLNLVNASHVFLCEPLLNTPLELQAIARVDRIGQQHETTVWLYVVSGTVEESIYNLSVQRRMEHMGRRSNKAKAREATLPDNLLDASFDAANTLELEHAALSRLMSKDKSAGEMVDKGDLWQCLFGHVAAAGEGSQRNGRLQEKAVMSYMAGEAAEERRLGMQ
ncbi:putative ATP-dependent helicase [Tolypocladium ophioglossoides CBS 100239]|uniref:Putative ATP-dependent helicase n=1 Tax=Tolypocladium ophioglossoides (strain CBS 100239) TaxID=1163406 RepID=A0A0L0NHH1_TOLOC|nr:putative ATP-dependent helicase [Tolypocladium ophioglossoides CBS 100239]